MLKNYTGGIDDMESIWRQYHPRVLGYFIKRVSRISDAEDLASISMMNFIQAMLRNKVQNASAYLWQIARNELTDFIKIKSNQPLLLSTEEINKLPQNFSSSSVLSERLEETMKCVKNLLSEEDYTILLKILLDKQSSVQIGKKMGIKPETIRKKLSRSLQKIKLLCIKTLA